MSNIYDLEDTWDDGGVTFDAIKMDVTDTASNAASKLINLQVGGTPKFTVNKDGGIVNNDGIFLGGVAAANKLEDYEEGTWTPVYSVSGGVWTPHISTYGKYTRIGDTIHIQATLIGAITGSPTGDVTITGLPFTVAALPAYGQAIAVGRSQNFNADHPRMVRVDASTTNLRPLKTATATGTEANLQAGDMSSISSYNVLVLGGAYTI